MWGAQKGGTAPWQELKRRCVHFYVCTVLLQVTKYWLNSLSSTSSWTQVSGRWGGTAPGGMAPRDELRRSCLHFYACICEFASDEVLAKKFEFYIQLDWGECKVQGAAGGRGRRLWMSWDVVCIFMHVSVQLQATKCWLKSLSSTHSDSSNQLCRSHITKYCCG